MNRYAKPLNGLVALVVELPNRCKRCESVATVIGNASDTKIASLHCQRCGADRGQLPHSTQAFVCEIINRFGRPTAPIKIRRSERTRKDSEIDSECALAAASADQERNNNEKK